MSELPAAKVEMIERWRFDTLRRGAVVSLHELSSVLRQLETGDWCGSGETYQHAMEAFAELAKALNETVQP